jgi:hypothetical protein
MGSGRCRRQEGGLQRAREVSQGEYVNWHGFLWLFGVKTLESYRTAAKYHENFIWVLC